MPSTLLGHGISIRPRGVPQLGIKRGCQGPAHSVGTIERWATKQGDVESLPAHSTPTCRYLPPRGAKLKKKTGQTASSLPGRKRRPGLEKGSPLLPALCFITIINVSLSLPPPSLLLTPPLLPSDPDPRPSPFGLVPPNSRKLAAATAQPRPYQSRLQSASLGFQASATAAVNRGHYRQQRARLFPFGHRSFAFRHSVITCRLRITSYSPPLRKPTRTLSPPSPPC